VCDEPAATWHRGNGCRPGGFSWREGRRVGGRGLQSARCDQGRAGREARRVRDRPGQSALREEEQRDRGERGGWIYDLRTNLHFTLKENTLKRGDLDDFVRCYHPANRHERQESERFKGFRYEELVQRDKVNLDIFWLKDEALEESANLPAPEIIAADIAADLEAALEQFATIAEDLK